MEISRKAFLTILAGGSSLLYAVLGWVVEAPVWLWSGVAGAVAAGTSWISSVIIHRSPALVEISYADRTLMARGVAAASAAHVAWITGFGLRPDAWPAWVAGLAALGLGEYAAARGLEYKATHLGGREQLPAPAELPTLQEVTRSETAAQVGFRAALERARLGWLRLLECERIGSVGWRFVVQVPSQGGKAGEAASLTPSQGEHIAIALSEVTGVPLMSDWVRIAKLPYAGQYAISVVTEDVMGRVIPYVDDPTPTSITEPCIVGYQLDGTPAGERLDQHGQTIGKSRWGKTSLVHVKGAHITRCWDAVWWVCGTEKVYDLVAGWLQPYEGTDRYVPIDWIAQGLEDTLQMLVGAMRLARYRQRVPLSRRRRWRKIIITLDEAAFALRNRSQAVMYDGKMRTADELVAMLRQGAGSGEVYVHLITQRGTNDQLGDYGGDTKAQAGFTEVFASQDPDELGRAFGDYKLPRPRHRGEFWANLGEGEVLNLKAPYIQEVDPARERLHDGVTIADVSWARRDLVADQPLDDDEAAAVGEAYITRRRTADELVAYLTGETAPVEQETGGLDTGLGADASYQAGRAAAAAELEALLGPAPSAPAAPTTPVPAPAAAVAPAAVAEIPARLAPRRDRIVELVRAAGAMTTGQIIEALREQEGEDISETSVANTLRELVADGTLERPQKGHYRLPQTSPHLTSPHVAEGAS